MTEKTNPPSAKQLRYLRNLAETRGESFAYPQSAAAGLGRDRAPQVPAPRHHGRAPLRAARGQPRDRRARRRRPGARLRDRRLRLERPLALSRRWDARRRRGVLAVMKRPPPSSGPALKSTAALANDAVLGFALFTLSLAAGVLVAIELRRRQLAWTWALCTLAALPVWAIAVLAGLLGTAAAVLTLAAALALSLGAIGWGLRERLEDLPRRRRPRGRRQAPPWAARRGPPPPRRAPGDGRRRAPRGACRSAAPGAASWPASAAARRIRAATS